MTDAALPPTREFAPPPANVAGMTRSRNRLEQLLPLSGVFFAAAQLELYSWVPWMVGFAVLLLASGVGGLRTNALPKPIALIALVLGVAFLTPVGYFALFAFPLWTLATSIALYRAQHAARRSLGRAAPQVA